MTKILAFSGSIRKESFNTKTLHVAVQGAREAGAEVTVIDLKDYPLPLYNGDLEEAEGLPENVGKLKKLINDHDALLVASPEYNSAFTPLFKNTFDWLSRPDGEDPALKCFQGKPFALVSASPGKGGGVRSLTATRTLLENCRITVIPEQATVPSASDAFDKNGQLKDPAIAEAVKAVGKALAQANLVTAR